MTSEQLSELQQRFEYHRHLSSRRWQYFAGLTVVDGLLLNALSAQAPQAWAQRLLPTLASSAMLCAFVTLMLLSHDRESVESNYAAMTRLLGRSLMRPMPWGRVSRNSVTLWLYLGILALMIPWVILLADACGAWVSVGACLMFTALCFLGKLRIRHRAEDEVLAELDA
jgi:hypothetical protein